MEKSKWVSIPNGSIKIIIKKIYKKQKGKFQFQMVRLKYKAEVVVVGFALLFQFQMVRLKYCGDKDSTALLFRVSIPNGSIKIGEAVGDVPSQHMFQFQMVRLKS